MEKSGKNLTIWR